MTKHLLNLHNHRSWINGQKMASHYKFLEPILRGIKLTHNQNTKTTGNSPKINRRVAAASKYGVGRRRVMETSDRKEIRRSGPLEE